MKRRNSVQTGEMMFWIAVALSILFHVAAFFLAPQLSAKFDEVFKSEPEIEIYAPLKTDILSESEFQKRLDKRRIVETEAGELKEKAPDAAPFLGERTQRVKKQTIAPGFGTLQGAKRLQNPPPATSIEKRVQRLERLGLSSSFGKKEDWSREKSEDAPSTLTYGTTHQNLKDVAIGAQTLLNTDEYVYASFFNRLKAEIAPRWEPLVRKVFSDPNKRFVSGSYLTETLVVLDSSGEVFDVQLKKLSGVPLADEAAKQAILQSRRFKNPPEALRDQDGYFRFSFSFEMVVSEGGLQMDYVPDPRFQ